ncbi:MAG: hypothetical protein KF851_15380 [Pirellulaceae bacterium]|jgi:uncharacterized protein|nr:hypothetical protein [Pirellulaceae bacterium]
MNHYIYKIQPTRIEMLSDGPTPEESQVVSEHFSYLQSLANAGRLFIAGRTLLTDERTFGVAVFAAASEQEARAVLAEDPAILHGVMRGEVYPFRVALWSGKPLAAPGEA